MQLVLVLVLFGCVHWLVTAPTVAQELPSFEQLKAQERARAGDPEFDYRLGLAALAAGKPVDAVFALSRAVKRRPRDLAARLPLARAYLMLGDLEAARRQVVALSAAGASAVPLPVLDRYVAALDATIASRGAALEAALMNADYRRGIALLDSGHVAEAAEAFRGILERNPEHLPARAELGRAYALQGDYAAARQELARVAGEERVPEAVRETIDRYVAALDARLGQERTRVDGYVRARAGYDSNVNNATDEERILIPAFSGLGLATLSADAREQADGFAEAAGRLSVVHAVSPTGRILADAYATLRKNFEESRFDQMTLGGNLGFGWEPPQGGNFTLAAQAQTFLIDDDVFRNAFGGLAGWSLFREGAADLSANLQYAYLEYPDDAARDAHRVALGGTVGTAVGGSSYVYGGAYVGREAVTESRFDHLSQWFLGARFGAETELTDGLTLYGAITAERQIYDDEEPLFMAERRTWRVDGDIGVRYRLGDDLTLLANAGYTRADSNIVLFDYDRFTASVGVEVRF